MVAVESSKASRTRQKPCDALLVYLLIAVAVVTLLSIFGPTLYLVEQQQNVRGGGSGITVDSHLPPRKIVQVDDLKHEELFRKTIKSCIPAENPKCKEFVPDPLEEGDGNGSIKKKKVQRVALVTPPGDIASSLLNRIEDIAHEHNKRSNKKDLDIEVILTSHVPPYGYGKTHGLTKIIRLVPRPLLLEVLDALTGMFEIGETYKQITLDDLKAALRMILRLHCRLSHVAAHTALDSIAISDLLADPSDTVSQIHSFLAPNDGPPERDNSNGDDDLEFEIDDDQAEMLETESAFGRQILTHVEAESGQDVLDVLDRVLMAELEHTNNFSKWPCLPFWGAGGDEPGPQQQLSPLTQRLARALSPDCSDPYNNCFVQRDKCEFEGDAVCAEPKQNKKNDR